MFLGNEEKRMDRCRSWAEISSHSFRRIHAEKTIRQVSFRGKLKRYMPQKMKNNGLKKRKCNIKKRSKFARNDVSKSFKIGLKDKIIFRLNAVASTGKLTRRKYEKSSKRRRVSATNDEAKRLKTLSSGIRRRQDRIRE